MKNQLITITLTLLIGILTGSLMTVNLVKINMFTTKDLMEAEEIGMKKALDLSKPSEKLESVCAALWLKTNDREL